jgi:hypothetical protein
MAKEVRTPKWLEEDRGVAFMLKELNEKRNYKHHAADLALFRAHVFIDDLMDVVNVLAGCQDDTQCTCTHCFGRRLLERDEPPEIE